MQKTPKSLRLHIGIFGKRNAGKSSILNSLTGQSSSIVSSYAGTTTDPVEKPMELLPIGPVLFIDTAGIDDIGALGEMRIERTRQVIKRTDLAVIVIEPGNLTEFELDLIKEFHRLSVPYILAVNKTDLKKLKDSSLETLKQKTSNIVICSAETGDGITELRKMLIKTAPPDFLESPAILSDLVGPGGIAVLVVPIDKEAPKGRLIMPQVQSIRDLLDGDSSALVCKDRELMSTLDKLKHKPDLVVTDSQAFLKVAADTPLDVPMTSFSILFARFKGDLVEMTKGAMVIENLEPTDKIMICESCTHHPITDDIGTVKIPRWLHQFVGGKLQIDHWRGHDWPENLEEYKLIIHCGGCMWNKREMLSRIMTAREAGVPITNYGLTIAYTLGIFERSLKPFPAAWEVYNKYKT
ncbi:[FeFe] hydrogenase H-cluster maturation GTPase HydF [Sedimentisphaera salicampi]|uniref:[FeFe] hydrogenase H-cluster maturation GTPase HydF n=1 Tax=Sedimentisphaera salicampi TaxID=1941349 RepID=UPI000B9B9513|nr:[FeFe] hydrogenase H-cluster maturation GTPase HydF [Sedimentisphaera salicampi]OXU15901.1 tRNA modification GTPase MnmE [Sedimentisphaera salicampi]